MIPSAAVSRSPAAIDADLSRATAELAELIRQRGELSARIEAAEARVRALTAEGQGLLDRYRSVNVQDVTSAERVIQRRGRAVAKSRAAETKDKRREAIAARWGSQAKAAKFAGVSPAALVGYLDGAYPIPKRVALKLAIDPALPATRETWQKGVVE